MERIFVGVCIIGHFVRFNETDNWVAHLWMRIGGKKGDSSRFDTALNFLPGGH
jgi:hypothetical protein